MSEDCTHQDRSAAIGAAAIRHKKLSRNDDNPAALFAGLKFSPLFPTLKFCVLSLVFWCPD